MSGSLSDFFSGLGTGVSNLFDWLAAPSAAQQAMQAGRWNDPALAASDRTSGLLQGAIQGAIASQKGLGPGASLAASLLPMSQAGLAENAQRANIGEALARAGLTGAQTNEINTLLPFRTQGVQATTALQGAQTNEINQLLQPRIANLQASTGFNQANTWALLTKTPAEVHQLLAAAGLDEARIQAALIELEKTRMFVKAAGLPDPTAGLPRPGAALPGYGLQSGASYTSPALAQSEGGGNYQKLGGAGGVYAGTYQFGAPLLSDLGVYTPGKDENWPRGAGDPRTTPSNAWTGSFHDIPGHPEVKTLQDFLSNPGAQEAVQQKNLQNSVASITRLGLDKYIGQTIGGVPVTLEGMTNAIHLGGVGGLTNWLQTGGNTDVADKNGTKISDYMRLGAKSTAAPTAPPTAPPAASAAPTAAPAPVAAATPPQGALPPPGATLQALLAGVQQARSGVRPPGVLAPVLTAGPGAPTGNPPAAVPAPGAMPAPGAALQPYTGLSFGGAPRTFSGAGAGAPGSAVAPAAPGGAPASAPAPAPQAAPAAAAAPGSIPMQSTPAVTVPAGLGAPLAPGMILPGDQRVGGEPLYGIQPGDSIQTIVQKGMKAGVLLDSFEKVYAAAHPPIALIRTGTGDNGFDPGERVYIAYDQNGKIAEMKQMTPGQSKEYVVQQANKLREDFSQTTKLPSYVTATSQVAGAWNALQEDKALSSDPNAPASPATQLQMMHALWQLMNPSAVVRQGSIEATTADPRVPEVVQRFWNKYVSNGGQLTTQEQGELVRNIESAYKGLQTTYNAQVQETHDRANTFNLPKTMWDSIARKDTSPTRYSAWDKANPYEADVGTAPRGAGPATAPAPNLGGFDVTGMTGAPGAAAPAAGKPAMASPYAGWNSAKFTDWATSDPKRFNALPQATRDEYNAAWAAQRATEAGTK